MKLDEQAIIAKRKLTEYLLTPRSEDDKSEFLASAGYSMSQWRLLEQDIRRQLKEGNAHLIRVTRYGEIYHIRGTLTGPSGSVLRVITVWIRLHATGETRFVTLVPDKEVKR